MSDIKMFTYYIYVCYIIITVIIILFRSQRYLFLNRNKFFYFKVFVFQKVVRPCRTRSEDKCYANRSHPTCTFETKDLYPNWFGICESKSDVAREEDRPKFRVPKI